MKTPRKIMIAVYCEDDEQARAVQNIAKEFCSQFSVTAKDIMGFYPLIIKNKALLKEAANTISKGGKAAAFRIVPSLLKALFN